jgi:arylsulfatase A
MRLHQRTIIRFLLTIALLLLPATLAPAVAASGEKPNIVFLLIDDMGWPDVACYGHAFHETPVIDRLARDGMKFTDFYAATPVCSSTRSTIQSGQYSARTCITDFIPGHWRPFERLIVPPIEHHLSHALTTPGEALQAAGYVTGYFGKWHLGNGPEHAPDRHGYQVTGKLGSEFPRWQREHGSTGRGPKSIDLLTDQTVYFIEQNKDRPLFVTLSHHTVHIPLEAHADTLSKYRNKPKPKDGVNHPTYAAMVEDLDRSIKRILDKLDELDLSRKTLVVFTSDNGGLRKIYTGVGEVVSTNAPLRDEKGTLYEGGIRVPMIVRWPGVVPAGTTCGVPTTTADLLPTFCQVAGIKLQAQPIDGASLLPLLKDEAATLDREAIYFHYPHYHHSRPAGAIRAGDWKLLQRFEDGQVHLYNLADDLSERDDLADEYPDRADAMRAKLHDWYDEVDAKFLQAKDGGPEPWRP